MEKDMMSLIDKIYECQTMCKYCFNACLEEDSVRMLTKCIRLTVECAEICGVTMSSLSFEGDFTKEVLELCAINCRKCAEECRKHDHMHCIECAKACEECAKACSKYTKSYAASNAA